MGNSSSTPTPAELEKKKHKDKLSQQEAKVLADDCCDDTDFSTRGTLDDEKKKLKRSDTLKDPIDLKAISIDPKEYVYPFENLVLEGGGNKGLAYVGAIQCLEECGAIGQIKRVAGASAGAITAALFAVGYNWKEIFEFLSGNIEEVFLDHKCGYFSLLPNLVRRFGWNPGNEIHRWFGDKIKAKSHTGNPDMTFYDLYKERNMQLCVMVTNLNLMSAEYCHPKTTPDMPIRDALRMTMAIPGLFSAMKYDNHGQEDTYVDGGVLCNYPIHCFDGWYLSMDKKDSFLLRCQPLKELPTLMSPSNRFSPVAKDKTLGFLLYTDTEKEVMRYSLEKRIGCLLPERPAKETDLYKEKTKKKQMLEKAEREHARTVKSVEMFMECLQKANHSKQALHKNNGGEIEYITKEELRNALNDKEFTKEHKDRLFGADCDLDTAFKILDKDGNNKIAFFELVSFIEEHGIRMQTRFQGYGRRDINSFFGFLDALQGTLLTNLKFVFLAHGDVDRTVGINTGHVGTNNWGLEEADRDFTCQRGYNSTHAYLRYFVAQHPDSVTKKDSTTTTDSDNDISSRTSTNQIILQEPKPMEGPIRRSNGASAPEKEKLLKE